MDTFIDSRVSELQNVNHFGIRFSGIEGPFDAVLAGQPAFQINFVSPVFGGLDTTEVYTILYTASYQGKSEPYQRHLDSFNKILSTVQIR